MVGPVITLALIAATMFGSAASPAAAVACDIEAYFLNGHAAGTNVRSAPSSNAPILRTMSGESEVVASISGFQEGWFRVTSLNTTGGDVDEIVFEGVGWVHRSQLHLDVAGGRHDLLLSPRSGSKAVGRVSGDAPDVELLGCSGGWALIRAGNVQGWLSRGGQCSIP